MIDDLHDMIDRVKGAVDLVDLIGDNVRLKRVGGRVWEGECPLHQDSDPSLRVWPDHWRCFGCNRGGDAIDWIQELTGSEWWDALRQVASRGGVVMPQVRRRRGPPPPSIVVPEAPAKYRAQPYVVVLPPDTEPYEKCAHVRMRAPVLSCADARRIERLHSRACLVYTDRKLALESARNAARACKRLMLRVRACDDGNIRRLLFRGWPDRLWVGSEPSMTMLMRHDTREEILALRADPIWQIMGEVLPQAPRKDDDPIDAGWAAVPR